MSVEVLDGSGVFTQVAVRESRIVTVDAYSQGAPFRLDPSHGVSPFHIDILQQAWCRG